MACFSLWAVFFCSKLESERKTRFSALFSVSSLSSMSCKELSRTSTTCENASICFCTADCSCRICFKYVVALSCRKIFSDSPLNFSTSSVMSYSLSTSSSTRLSIMRRCFCQTSSLPCAFICSVNILTLYSILKISGSQMFCAMYSLNFAIVTEFPLIAHTVLCSLYEPSLSKAHLYSRSSVTGLYGALKSLSRSSHSSVTFGDTVLGSFPTGKTFVIGLPSMLVPFSTHVIALATLVFPASLSPLITVLSFLKSTVKSSNTRQF